MIDPHVGLQVAEAYLELEGRDDELAGELLAAYDYTMYAMLETVRAEGGRAEVFLEHCANARAALERAEAMP